MSAQFYVKRAMADVAPLRSRLAMLGANTHPNDMVDVAQVATIAGNCQLRYVTRLTDRDVWSIVRSECNVDPTGISPSDEELAGALCTDTKGVLRWLFVRSEDSPERQRFTIAHELGHLFIEFEPQVERLCEPALELPTGPPESTIRVFSRCSATEAPPANDRGKSQFKFSDQDLREIRAHHFASELLMPYDGIKELISSVGGAHGLRDESQRQRLVRTVANRYSVSLAAAKRRIEKDFAVGTLESHENHDLFA